MNSFQIIGLMSGTSMDGVDMAFCRFEKDEKGNWNHRVISYESASYSPELLDRLKRSKSYSAVELLLLDKELGKHFAQCINNFIEKNEIQRDEIDAIASHGHTIFHQPENGFTYQIGCGDTLAYQTGIQVINDFRQKDIIAGGQGAPLVPIGDLLLFSGKADAFLNIGGFSNITFINNKVIAYDICPGNLPLNKYANELGEPYDQNGEIARSGNLIPPLLSKLNSIPYYSEKAPKSLGTEWLDDEFYIHVPDTFGSEDKLRTCVEHISQQISNNINNSGAHQVMVTGGGAYNSFLIEMIRSKTNSNIYLPDNQLIEFKEAIVFGFLGALYLSGESNVLPFVTGAEKPTTGGVLHKP